MNKTININLGGFFFHIDEIAYQKLKRYLESISKSLNNDPQGKDEIITDIEARISELLTEKTTDTRQVVNEADIDDIIKIMGQPEDYAEAEESYNDSSYSYQRNKISRKKLFRDPSDKFLGGVASGIAQYLNIDTIWTRLGFFLLIFGVGFGILLYIILWVLLPEANTTAEKLQMEGEPVNIDNIEKKIRQEFTSVSANVKDIEEQNHDKVKDDTYEFSKKTHKTFSVKAKKNSLQVFFNTLGKIILICFKIIGKIIGAILILIAVATILFLIIGVFSLNTLEHFEIMKDLPFFLYDALLPKWALTLTIFLLVGIPFLTLFVLGLRIVSSNVKQFSKSTSLTLLGVWIVALLSFIFTIIDFNISYKTYGQASAKKPLNLAINDPLTLKMYNDDSIYYHNNLRRTSEKQGVEVNDIKMLYTNNIKIDVKKSNSSKAYYIIKKHSQGRSKIKAKKNAEKIKHNISIQENTVIIDAFFLSEYKNLWKTEIVHIIFYLPENRTVYFDNSMKNFLFNIKKENGFKHKDITNHHFIMSDNNTLKCTDCKD